MNLRRHFRRLYFGRAKQSQHNLDPPARVLDSIQFEEARKSEALLAAAEQLANLGSWRYDVASDTMTWSAQLYRMLGLGAHNSSATKELLLQVVHPNDRVRVLQGFQEASSEGNLIDREARFVLPDGRIRINHIRAAPIMDPSGQVVRLVGMLQDITERKEAEEKLRKSEALLAQAEQLANLGSWEFDLHRNSIIWSDQMFRTLGMSPQHREIAPEFFWGMVHPDDRERAQREQREAIAERRPIDYEVRCVFPDGRVRTIQARAVPFYDESGQPLRLVGMSQDITERKEAEEKLRKSEALLAQAEQLANVGSWELDLKTDTVVRSDQSYRMLNLVPRGASEKVDPFWQMVHPDDRERVQREQREAIAERRSMDFEMRWVFPDGRVRTIQARAMPFYDEFGQPLRLVGMSQDITERKEAEENLRKSEALLAQAEEIADLGSWELDVGTRKATLSKQLFRMFALDSPEQWEEERYWQNFLLEDRQRVREMSDQAIAECRPFEFVARYRMPDGTVRTYSVRGLPVPGTDGKTERVRGIVQDITEQMRAEEDLRRLSQQLLRTRDAERRQMARELHETAGQSLAALKMMLGRLRDALPEDDEMARGLVERSVEVAEDAVREVRLVSYLMHPPMLDEGGLGLALQWYVRGFSERSGIQAQVEVADNFGRYPQEIETTIFRVVQEALTNVHRYSGSRTVAIRLAREDGQIRAEVRDEGCGLALPAPPMGWDAPLGVGIAGMRERVKQLHGVFEIESAPGRGTTVRAILPIPHEDASSTAAGEAPKELRMDRERQKSKEKRAGR
jgi:PAS domain S-box-containing protein